MHKKPVTFSALCRFLGMGKPRVRELCREVGVVLEPNPPHYADERPRTTTKRRFKKLIQADYIRVIERARRLQGEKALKAKPKP